MAAPAWDKKVIERAKRDGLSMCKIEISGRYSSDGSVAISSDITKDQAKRLEKFIVELFGATK